MNYYGIYDTVAPVKGEAKRGNTADEQSQHDMLRLAIKMCIPGKKFELNRLRDLDEATNQDEVTVAATLRKELAAKPRTAEQADDDSRGAVADADEKTTIVAVGRGAEFAVRALAELAKFDAESIATGCYRPGIVNLVLVVPKLDTDAFAEDGSSLRAAALASAVCDRVVVFHGNGGLPTPECREIGMPGSLGHVGPSGACLRNVLCIDISHLTLGHRPCVQAAMESLEVLGLVGRAVAGTGSTALADFAKRMHSAPKPAP